jgi:hypothetical protein
MSLPDYPKYKDSGVEWMGEVPLTGVGRVAARSLRCSKLRFVSSPLSSASQVMVHSTRLPFSLNKRSP